MELQKYEGDVYLARIIDGVNQGMIGPLECESFQPKREDGDKIELKSKRRDIYDQTIFSETAAGSALLAMSFKDIRSNLFGLAFAAEPTSLTYAAAAITDEVVSVAKAGTLYSLSKRNVKTSPLAVVKDNTGVTTYVAGTDYTLDVRLGMIAIVAGGAIDTALITLQAVTPGAALPIKVSYSYNAFAGESYNGEAVTEAKFAVFFDGKNRISKKDISVEYYEVNIKAPADGMDLLSSELITVELEGTAVTPAGKASPSKILRHS